jgi:hypothetical protein
LTFAILINYSAEKNRTCPRATVFSSQKRTNRKKRKSHKLFVFAQDKGIRNWVEILLASTSLPLFTIAKKTWHQASCNFVFIVHS